MPLTACFASILARLFLLVFFQDSSKQAVTRSKVVAKGREKALTCYPENVVAGMATERATSAAYLLNRAGAARVT
jgi:hypothetical protein